MPDTSTDNFGLTKISPRKGWGDTMNNNLDRLGKLFCEDNDGNFWMIQNAIYDPATDTWSQPDTSKTSHAIFMDLSSGDVIIMTCAAGNATITWVEGFLINKLDGIIDAKSNDLIGVNEFTCQDYMGAYLLTAQEAAAQTITYTTPPVLTVSTASDVSFYAVPDFEVTVPSQVATGSKMRFCVNANVPNPGDMYYCRVRLHKNGGSLGYLATDEGDTQIYDGYTGDLTMDNVSIAPGDVFTIQAELYCKPGYVPRSLTIYSFKPCYNAEIYSGLDWS